MNSVRFIVFVLVLKVLTDPTNVSSAVRVVRTRPLNYDSHPNSDVFINPSCKADDCSPSGATCQDGSCCTCQCSYGDPNFLVKGWKCRSNREAIQLTHSNCTFYIRPDNEPLEVLFLTESSSGKVKFRGSTRVNCDSNQVIVDNWKYLDSKDLWIDGSTNPFKIEHKTVGGPTGNKKDLSFLKWNNALDKKYAGLLIRVSLRCKNKHSIGCFLTKVNGTHTYSTSTTVPTTGTPISTESPIITIVTTSKTGESTNSAQTRNPSTTSSSEATPKPNVQSNDKRAASNNKQSSAAVGRTVGIVGGIVALICLILLLGIILYRKRKIHSCLSSRSSHKEVQRNKKDLESNAHNVYEDPIYTELPDKGPDFDNPVYSDPANVPDIMSRRSKMDPLPMVPGMESTYQPLNEATRTHLSDTPPLSQESRPEGEDIPAFNHDNPAPEVKELPDYDNPSTSSPQENTKSIDVDESRDYDNPATSPPRENTKSIDVDESRDYDNPSTNLNQRSTINAGHIGVDVNPGLDNQEADGPEYLELEPNDTNHDNTNL